MNITPLVVLQVAFGAWVTWDFVRYLRSGKLKRHLTVFAKRRWHEWALGLILAWALLVAAIVVASVLISAWPAGMGWTWLKLLATQADGPVQGQNLNLAAAKVPWFGLVFVGLLALNMPRLVRREEEVFRRWTRDWVDAVPRSLKFGLMHCIVGVPIGVGFALALPGLAFTAAYFRGGVRTSTFFHLLYNFSVLGFVAWWLLS